MLSATRLLFLEDPHFIWKGYKSGYLTSGLALPTFFTLCLVCFYCLQRAQCRGLAPALQTRVPFEMAEPTPQLRTCAEAPHRTLNSRWPIFEFLKNKLKFLEFFKKPPKMALNNVYAVFSLSALQQFFSLLISFTQEIVRNENSVSSPHTECSQWFSNHTYIGITQDFVKIYTAEFHPQSF